MRTFKILAILVIAILIYGGQAAAATATAKIGPTQEGSAVQGEAHFNQTEAGLEVTAQISGVKPGDHGFHIHEIGACGDEGKAAGGHYNPAGAPHGLLSKDGPQHAHAGDMGNFLVAADGTGKLQASLPGITLTDGPYAVAGRAVILHEKEDDFSQPTGNAGGRIGCGVIEIDLA